MRTISQSKGSNDWFNYRFDLVPADAKPPFDMRAMIPRTDPLFAMGREFYDLARAGKVKADEGSASRDEDGDAPPF
jgi:hypothetical protein